MSEHLKNYRRDYQPIFHKDGTISYWYEGHGWQYRKYPSMIPHVHRLHWKPRNIARYNALMAIVIRRRNGDTK